MIEIDPQKPVALFPKRFGKIDQEKRPRFLFQNLTRRDVKDADTLISRLTGARRSNLTEKTAGKLGDDIQTYLAARLLGWQNINEASGKPIRFKRDDLDRVLDMGDMCELLVMYRYGVTEEEKKTSALQSRSNGKGATRRAKGAKIAKRKKAKKSK